MKKILALVLAALLALSCVAFAEEAPALDPETCWVFNYELGEGNHVTDWAGNWAVVGAYVGEDADVDTVGLVDIEPGIVTMVLEAELDASATDKALGVMVDVANYLHDHVHDLTGTLYIGDVEFEVSSKWDQWPFNPQIKADYEGGFNFGPVMVKIKHEKDDLDLHFADLTGVEIEDLGDYKKYIGLNANGQLVVCFSDENTAKEAGPIVAAYIFEKVEG